MLTFDNLQEVLNSHHQKHPMSCVASAFELVAKLHGLIPLNSFPLQDDPKNQEQSFGNSEFLTTLGLKCVHDLYDIDGALALLVKETHEEKYPLIALMRLTGNRNSYHIYCVVLCNNQLMLIDPALQRSLANSIKDLTKVIQDNSQMNPERKTLDILLYEYVQDN